MNKTALAVSYDIVKTKRRTKIAKMLKQDRWIRIQYSVWIKKTTLKKSYEIISELDKVENKHKMDSIILMTITQKNIDACRDNNRIKYYLSEEIEHIRI